MGFVHFHFSPVSLLWFWAFPTCLGFFKPFEISYKDAFLDVIQNEE
jgi:hypothetical protein